MVIWTGGATVTTRADSEHRPWLRGEVPVRLSLQRLRTHVPDVYIVLSNCRLQRWKRRVEPQSRSRDCVCNHNSRALWDNHTAQSVNFRRKGAIVFALFLVNFERVKKLKTETKKRAFIVPAVTRHITHIPTISTTQGKRSKLDGSYFAGLSQMA